MIGKRRFKKICGYAKKNYEEKIKIEPEKKKERQQQRREKTLKGQGMGLEIHR